MKLAKITDQIVNESDLIEQVIPLNGKKILELGCGKADVTRLIATSGSGREITATEVDEIQHTQNLLINDLPNVNFILAGSELIPFDAETFDAIFMFKSLHHVPESLMKKALQEVARVLVPGGLAYMSEPIFAGEYNEVLRLFHDEEQVRLSAFNALKNCVDDGTLTLEDELFFNTRVQFDNFGHFEDKLIKATHTDHQLSASVLQLVKDKFGLHLEEGGAKFLVPIRVDILKKTT